MKINNQGGAIMNKDNKTTNLLTRFINWLGNKPVNEQQMLDETDYLLKDKSAEKIHDILENSDE